jgi:hypothetical protein
MRRDEPDGPDIDDWLADEDPFDAPTRESSGRGRRPPGSPPPNVQGRRVIAVVAIASVILLIIVVLTRGGDEEPAVTEPPSPTAPTETGSVPESDVPPPPLVLDTSGTLTEGDSGRPVRRLQRALALLGYDIQPDGQYGPGTTDAVRQFQADAGLEVDGVAGPGTLAAINQALAGIG